MSSLGGLTAYPIPAWVTQAARNLAMRMGDALSTRRFLIRDRDAKFCSSFDEVLATEGLRVISTAVRAPQANAYAERWVGTLRRECLDSVLVLGRRHLEAVLGEYVDHYNGHRPHRSLGLHPPAACGTDAKPAAAPAPLRVRRRDRLGGLIHEYRAAA